MSKPPQRYQTFMQEHETVGTAYKALGEATTQAGPLDKKTVELVKLGISIGMRHEGAVHAHARRALDAGCSAAELKHTAILATTTLGFPSMMAALSWIEDVVDAS